MPVIVAFGDSNTWGYDPAGSGRLPPDVRWTGIMRAELGAGFTVIEEGLNGRTTVFDDPIEPNRRGLDYLPPCLRSHAPMDLLIIGLGCNDMKARFNASPSMIAAGVERLVVTARAEPVGPGGQGPKILIVAPPPLAELTGFAEMFEGATAKAPKLPALYADVARRHGAGFVSAGDFIHCSALDGIHFEADQHAILGRVLAEAARMVLA